jgi:hypothetical protein
MPHPKTTSHKAYVAGGSSGVLALLAALLAGSNGVDWRDLAAAVAAGAVTGALTWAKRNHPVEAGEGGQVNIATVAAVLVIVLIVVLLFLLTPLNWGHG